MVLHVDVAEYVLDGDDGWLEGAIHKNTLVTVTDGSYMQALHPNMSSCAFILECTQGRGCLTGAFFACSYHGELLKLMAIYLILLSINRIASIMMGSAHIYLDCLDALDKIQNLPPHHTPSKCQH